MNLKDKNILIFGLSITGIAAVKALYNEGVKLTVLDSRKEDDENIKNALKKLTEFKNVNYVFGANELDLNGFDLILKSPGIKPDIPILNNARDRGIEILSDIELAYRLNKTKHIIAITGSNGKTTTSTLVYEILKNSGKKSHLVGNVGVGILEEIVNATNEDYFIIECSSFQLENTMEFSPEVSLITNITPDHLDWHGNFQNYANAKYKILKNQKQNDITVLNVDDSYLMEHIPATNSKLIKVSKNKLNSDGAYISNEKIFINDNSKEIEIMNLSDIKLLGIHNLENILCAVAISYFIGIDIESIRNTISKFMGVEHRIEFVRELNGVKFYNDSKGTNPDSTIKAIEAVDSPIILIAGGYDKGTSFDELAELLYKKVYLLILMGTTKEKIRNSAVRAGFTNIEYVENMNEAVNLAFDSSVKGNNILLSPACASWGMYNNYEERGRDFKNIVNLLKER